MRQHPPPGWQSFYPTTQHLHIHRGGITGLWALCVLLFCCCATGRKWHSEVLIEVYPVFSSSLLLSFKVWLNFIIKPTGFQVWGEEKEGVMTLQTWLFTRLLAAGSSLPASSEQQQQQRSATFALSVNNPPNKRLSSARERNLKLFTKSLGMFEWLQISSICTPPPPKSCLSVCLRRDLGGPEGLMSQLLQRSTRNAFWQLQLQQDIAQRCCCNCTWLRHEKVIICCQGRQGVSVRQELISYWLPPESLVRALAPTPSHSWLPEKEGGNRGWAT